MRYAGFARRWIGGALALTLAACGNGGPRSPDVDGSLQRLELTPAQTQIERGQTQAYVLTAVLGNGVRERVDGSAAVWSSSVPSVASIDAQGTATGLATGQTEIRARYRQREAVAFLSVVPPPITALEVRPATAEVAVGLTRQFVAHATYADGSQADLRSGVAWASADPSRATVDDAGLATGVGEGSVQISASVGARSDTATLTVTPAVVQALVVTPSTLTLAIGQSAQLGATAQYSDDTHVDRTAQATWTSASPAIATVASGLVTGKATGATQITATLDGLDGSAVVEVGALPPLPFKVGAAEAPASFLPIPGSVCIGGYDLFCEREALTERDPLVAGAVAISRASDDASVILVKTTNVGYFAAYKAGNGPNGLYDIRQRIARRLRERYGQAVVPADRIVVTSDHSHQGPDTIGIWGGVSPLYMAILAEAAVQAGVEAYAQRVPARLYVGSVQGPQTAGSYAGPPTDDPDREFRALFAEDRAGQRVATLLNYAPHATVLSSDNTTATGDWTAWAAQIASQTSGGVGIGLVGALGAMDWNKSGDDAAREAEARQRLRTLLDAAFEARSEVAGDTVAVKTVFVREPLAQPILLANYAPRVDVPGMGASLSIERAQTPPWSAGAVIGTYASAIRVGDVFIGAMPGEPFPQLHYALRDCATLPEGIEADTDCGGITGARANFLLGAANDFLGYMLYTPEQYAQAFQEGAFYLGGCPEEALLEALGDDVDGACPDHWALMVSPTIGRHMVCTLQNAAAGLGFGVGTQNPECPLLTALDGIAAPAEYPATALVPLSPAEFFDSPAAGVVAQCRAQGGPEALCAGLETVSETIGAQLGELIGATPQPPVPAGAARAGVAVRDASWHLGASAGQFAATGAGIARDAGFDPYGHSVKKVGSDTLGTRVTTRALVVEDGDGRRVGVVSNDLYLPNDLLHRRVAQLLAEHDALVQAGAKSGPVTGLSDANLAMTSSHSHTSPFYSTPGWGTWIFQDVMDLRFYDYMATQMSAALIEAVATMKPVRMGGITVHSNDVTSHTYGPKTAQDGTPAGQPYDYTTQQISVVRFDDVSDPAQPRPLANWVIFGVHPEWVWGEEIVNGDVTHAVMRMLDRETGAVTVWSQRETGASGPHKDTRAHRPEQRREFQESNFSGADRAARILTDTLKNALARIEQNRPEDSTQFAPLATRFRVDSVSARFAPPFSRPYPGVSNCNTDPLFTDLRLGLPILGFPDCFYDHNDLLEPLSEPLLAALPYSPTQLRDQLIAAGVPVPTSYSATSLTAVEETAAVQLQVFRLGDIVATFCPCEQFTSQALNLASRLDRVAGNLWTGWDWMCLAEERGLVETDARYAAQCARQKARYPESFELPIPGSLDDPAKLARARAQIHNDAAGWEAMDYALYAESEPLDPAQIKGNFTHEEFPERGYGLVLAVGMANDYWGYMPEYREYRAHDHYRKALNGLGPHGADYLATRLARMAVNLNGADEAMPLNPLDAVYQAESARAEALARTLGELARSYTAIYDQTIPPDGGVPAIAAQPAATVPRFSAAVVDFVGGAPYQGAPTARVERLVSGTADDGDWETYGTQEGEVQLQVRFIDALGTLPVPPNPVTDALDAGGAAAIPDPAQLLAWRAGQFEWTWRATFETFVSELPDLGARPPATPTGRYRFVVEGQKRGLVGVEDYRLVSAPFDVVPWGGITVEDLQVEGDGRVSFRIGPSSEHRSFRSSMANDAGSYDVPTEQPPYVVGPVDYPDSYTGGLSWIDPRRVLLRYGTDDRSVHQQYCNRCSFRPWADTAQVDSATISVRRGDGSTYTLDAAPQDGRWVSAAPIARGETAFVSPQGIVDQYGEFNAAMSATVTRP